MCGRATLTNSDINQAISDLDAEISPADAALFRPRYNIAPSDLHYVLASRAKNRVVVPALWGYLAAGRSLINVRGEQVASRNGFREAFASRRCLMITDGFFEWTKDRAPFWFHREDGGLVLLGGLFQPPGEGSTSRGHFAVLTTRPNCLVAQVHDRMPVVISPDCIDDWLTGDPADAAPLLAPLPAEELVATPVSRRVNSVKNDDPTCLAPPDSAPTASNERRVVDRQTRLF